MRTVRIESADDPRVADYADVREADRVKKRGIFLVEGTEVVRTWVAHGRFSVRSLFLAEKKLEQMEDVVRSLDADVPVYVAPEDVMDRVAGFPIHRGCLAAGERGLEPDGATLLDRLPRAKTLVVLEAIANHDNIGGIFRNALAFGVDAVLLDDRSADPLYRKAIRVSMGAVLRVPFARIADPVRTLSERGFTTVALTPRDAIAIEAFEWPDKVALFLGTEGEGLTGETLVRCEARASISMEPDVDSLNVASAAGIALFARQTAKR